MLDGAEKKADADEKCLVTLTAANQRISKISNQLLLFAIFSAVSAIFN